MQRLLWLSTTLIVVLTTQAQPARAQYYGYGPFAGGWGGYGYAAWNSTVQGDIARGLGEWAIGAGTLNELAAEADSIDADTFIRWNQYIAGVNQTSVETYFGRHKARRDQISAAREKTNARLRNNPDSRDITSGDALNLALDDLDHARTSLHNLKHAKVRIEGSLVRDIPLRLFGSPAASELLAGVDGRPETNLGDVVDAMNLGDLRFGVARTARQRALYQTLYPLLTALRDESRPAVTASKPDGGNIRRTRVGKADAPSRLSKNQVVFNTRARRSQ